MKCIKCFSDMNGPDYMLDMNEKYLSINPNKYISVLQGIININHPQEVKLSFVRNRPAIEMKAKLSMCCFECGHTYMDESNIKLKSQTNIERFFKNFAKKRRF